MFKEKKYVPVVFRLRLAHFKDTTDTKITTTKNAKQPTIIPAKTGVVMVPDSLYQLPWSHMRSSLLSPQSSRELQRFRSGIHLKLAHVNSSGPQAEKINKDSQNPL